MDPRFSKLPSSLAPHARSVRLGADHVPGGVPALLVHPNWISPAPTMLWMHGRTAHKELDAGRYARWMKAGIAAVAIDLPGHGERRDARGDAAAHTLNVLAQLLPEIDIAIEALADPVFQGVFDLDRMGLGGMSMGGMATLRRLCDEHEFVCAAVEAASGDLMSLYHPTTGSKPWGLSYPPQDITPLDPLTHLSDRAGRAFRPIPLLALHTVADRIVPWSTQQAFLARLRGHYLGLGADPSLVEIRTWPSTGAPEEHSGFGRAGNDAKNIQTEFLSRALLKR